MANFGNFCLLFALCLSAYALFAALIGASQRQDRMVRSAEHAAYAATASIALAFASLLYMLLTNDFSSSHVANNSNRSLPLFYKIAAIWGGHDGSMLLWVFFTSIFCGVVIYQNRSRFRDMMPYVLAVLMFNLSFFLGLNLFLSNPFSRLVQVFSDGSIKSFMPADGQGLNPLLQHWAMVIHPPILYLGFIGFVVPFAFAMAALVTKQLGITWIRTTRRWTLLTWLLLGIGIVLGAKWAYVVLGWGGYWAWDPVENSSLMPWLVGTAFLHSVVVQERRGMLKIWNMILVVITFLLGIFGTFITRSGVVSSVHAFADSNLGKFFLLYMALILFGSLYLIIDRRSYLRSERRLDSMLSRESAFLFNNLVLVVCCFAVFWGTIFPVFSEWIQGSKITIGPPFFDKINVPIGLLLLFLTGIGPLFAWRKTSMQSLKKAFLWPVVFSAITCAGLLAGGMRNFYTLVCLTLSSFVFLTIVEEFYKGAQIRVRSKGESFPAATVNLTLKNKRRYGGYIIHLAIVIIFVGLSGSAFNREATQQLTTGQEMQIGDYSLKMSGFQEGQTANYQYGQVTLEAYKDGKLVRTLRPEKRIFKTGNQQATTTVALYSTPREDLYVIFAGISGDSKFEIMAHVNPLVFWIWFGSAVMVLGSIITLLPESSSGQQAVRSRQ
jgi:cytochrome c-type biogenesis protein CcmF